MSFESATPPNDSFARLTSMMSPGLNQLIGNEELEIAYLDYQQTVLDDKFGDADNFYKVDQLPEHEQAQADAIVAQLALEGLASEVILRKRLERTRILQVESPTVNSLVGKAGGRFDNGLALVPTYDNPALQNHVRLHEIAHGLDATGIIADFGPSVHDFGGGLVANARLGKFNLGTVPVLNKIQEAIVDDLALRVSDLDPDAYLAGEILENGYWKEVRALTDLAEQQPDLAWALKKAFASDGVQNQAESELYTDAFMASDSRANQA